MSSYFGGGPDQGGKPQDGEWLDRLDRFMQRLLKPDKPEDSARGAKVKASGDYSEWLAQLVKDLLKPIEISGDTGVEDSTDSLVRTLTAKEPKKLTVTMQLPYDTNLRTLQVFATSELLRVMGLPDNRTHTVRFPCRVYPRSGRARLEDGRLVIKFRRRPLDQNEVELFIRL
ncbi:hypothetical protein E5161_03630 [Cohnella pontilimi]|uniref:Uncharacterized protein n=1 Tax=Cohnella pontilimi TaxID=2564100 RepID=A0A4U0FHP3_9BACL|nr:hypothetical protein [Cohnella pontilimi]TJY44481.1 hypothetical protein E5161_03630 [Cohnella pontilimi]